MLKKVKKVTCINALHMLDVQTASLFRSPNDFFPSFFAFQNINKKKILLHGSHLLQSWHVIHRTFPGENKKLFVFW